jgi:gliding motility-associated lipoprotein GldH
MFCVLLTACNKLDVFEKSIAFDKHEWKSANKPSFDFAIADTNVLYNIYVVVRHDDAYHYNNLWLNITTLAPASKPETQQIELTLANNAKGWLGTGMDDVFEHRIRITNAPIKLKKGNYHFTIQHTMREDPLPYVLSAGIRVEKVQP